PLSPVAPAPFDALPPPASASRSVPADHPPSILGAPIALPGESTRSVESLPPAPTQRYSIPAALADPPASPRPARAAGRGVPMAAGVGVTAASSPIAATSV